MEGVKDKIKNILVTRLKLKIKPEDIKDDMLIFGEKDLGLDSIDALELMVGLQKEFGIEIENQEVAEKVLVTINTIADFIDKSKNIEK